MSRSELAALSALRLTAEAIAEAAALDGERTAVDAVLRTRCGVTEAAVDITIGGWFGSATGRGDSADDAVRDCLRALAASVMPREQRQAALDATTRRVREALAAALAEVPT